MATLILTALGTAVGGPIGGAIGAVLGQMADRSVIGGPRREGPRLSDLKVQTSSYGTPIPRLFGRMRVAGTVIWATDLIERRSTTGGGKGGPSVTQYQYSASFAVLVSARRIQGIGRVWADGRLIRGQAGDWKVRTGFRLHTGDPDQAVDPLIASAIGIAEAPAWRGHAYLVFEELDLNEFGNRIPSLTVEVIADGGPVGGREVLTELSRQLDAEAPGTALHGIAIEGASIREAAQQVAAISGGWWTAEGDRLVLAERTDGDPVTVADRGWRPAGAANRAMQRTFAPSNDGPGVIGIMHYDPARDYQIGVQRAVRPGGGMAERVVPVVAAISADEARAMAERTLIQADAARERRRIGLDASILAMTPGQRVRIAGEPGMWRIDTVVIERQERSAQLVRIASTARPALAAADPGRPVVERDGQHGPTRLIAFELGIDPVAPPATPRLAIAASGPEPGWRQAVLLKAAAGTTWQPIGRTAQAAVIGVVELPPGPASALMIDQVHRPIVTLTAPDDMLQDADHAAIDAGANLAMIGDELIQFMQAEPLGSGRWRLSGLWRGRRGTEWAMDHAPGEGFCLIDRDALVSADLTMAAVGGSQTVAAQGIGDVEPVTVSVPIDARSVRPPSPVRMTIQSDPEAMPIVRWTRRSRTGWAWVDAIDAPLGEAVERYRVEVTDGAGLTSVDETMAPALSIDPAGRPRPWRIAIVQIGDYAASKPLVRTIS
ncbi:phage tail baseplate protein [Sphingomonas sp. CJ99]